MAWTVLAEGNPDEFVQQVSPIDDLPTGTRIRLEIQTGLPVAPIFDLWGMEWVVQKMYGDAEVIVEDVRSDGWYKAIIDMRVAGTPVALIIVAIAAVLVTAGVVAIVVNLRLMAEIAGPIGTTLLIAGGVLVLGLLAYAAYKTQVIERIPKPKKLGVKA